MAQRLTPLCAKCGRRHYNMLPCSVAEPPQTIYRTPDGFTNRLTEHVEIAPGVLGRARKAVSPERPF